jgi:hypothetical protein
MALTSHTPPSAFSILFMSPSVCSCAWLRGPSCGAAASEAPARRARRTAPVELRRADVNAAWQKPPWLHQKQALLTDFGTTTQTGPQRDCSDALSYVFRNSCAVRWPAR